MTNLNQQVVTFEGQDKEVTKTLKNIWVTNQSKGGTTKTTTSMILGLLLANDSHKTIKRYDQRREAKRVLFVDLDDQEDLTYLLLGQRITEGVMNAIDVRDARDFIYQVPNQENAYVLPAGNNLSGFDLHFFRELSKEENPLKLLEQTLRQAIIDLEIEELVIDTSPSTNQILLQTLNISYGLQTQLVVPIQVDALMLKTYEKTLETVEEMKKMNPNLAIKKIIPVLIEATKLDKKILDAFKEAADERAEKLLSKVVIKKRAKIKEMLMTGFDETNYEYRKAMSYYRELLAELQEE